MKQNLDVIRKLGAIDDGEGLDYFIPQESQVPKQDIPTSHQLGYIAIVISDLPKVFSAEKVKELCASIDHPIILLGDRSDSLTAEGIRRADGVKIYSACGKFSLHETADLIRHARLVISPATSLFYITLALKRPVIQIKPNSTIAQIKTRIDFLPQSP